MIVNKWGYSWLSSGYEIAIRSGATTSRPEYIFFNNGCLNISASNPRSNYFDLFLITTISSMN